ncbi:hypothetical protein [Niveibacterium umoris]|uniref:Porin domain-containing protein n=1 Tax=Niveibacterium umoris TaxID=1193620 RepID=A0A840BHH8_9RHOO|nr:hypothetical protein [Niveibacterium umoris]MBB4011714.1 hypothetical protein [Niveibacterium umoris]
MRHGVIALAALFSAAASAGDADTLAEQSLQFGGFGTLGWAWSDVAGADFRRDVSQAPSGTGRSHGSFEPDSRVGIQASYRYLSAWSAVGQLVSRYRYDGSWRPELTWGFLSYLSEAGVTARAGRLGFDVYPLADSTNVGYTYLPVRPPTEYYGTLPIQSLDGLDVSYLWPVGTAAIKTKAYIGTARSTIPVDEVRNYSLNGSPLVGAYLEYQGEPWSGRLGYSRIKLKDELPLEELFTVLRDYGIPGGPELADRLSVKGRQFGYLVGSLSYQAGGWQAILAASYFHSNSDAIQGYYSGYAHAGYRVGPVTPYLVLSAARSNDLNPTTGLPPVPALAPVEAAANRLLQVNLSDQRSVALGVRYDPMQNIAVKLQADRVSGTRSSTLWFGDADLPDHFRFWVFSAALDFAF